jgi:hypothetical protein
MNQQAETLNDNLAEKLSAAECKINRLTAQLAEWRSALEAMGCSTPDDLYRHIITRAKPARYGLTWQRDDDPALADSPEEAVRAASRIYDADVLKDAAIIEVRFIGQIEQKPSFVAG